MGKNESDAELRFYKKNWATDFHETMQFMGENPVMKGCNFWARDRQEMMQFVGDSPVIKKNIVKKQERRIFSKKEIASRLPE